MEAGLLPASARKKCPSCGHQYEEESLQKQPITTHSSQQISQNKTHLSLHEGHYQKKIRRSKAENLTKIYTMLETNCSDGTVQIE